MGLTELLFTTAMLAMCQLALGKPIRGGVDIGAGIEADGQLYGASLVKAYMLESKAAQSPRIVAGGSLVRYLDQAASLRVGGDVTARWRADLARRARVLVEKDEDELWILDFAGRAVRQMFPGMASMGLYGQAVQFARAAREQFRTAGDKKLFERYSKVVRYLDSRADLWGAA